MIAEFIVTGNPIPKVRATTKSKFKNPAVKRSLAYQKVIAEYFMSIKGKLPERKFSGDVYAVYVFYRKLTSPHCDVDNLVKAVNDGLEYGQAFDMNDRQVKKVFADLRYDDDNPRAEIFLTNKFIYFSNKVIEVLYDSLTKIFYSDIKNS